IVKTSSLRSTPFQLRCCVRPSTETPSAVPKGPKPKQTAAPPNLKKHVTQQSVDAAIWSICDIMRRGNVASALQYVPELTWILFLRILDESETREAMEAEALGNPYTPSIGPPYRWTDWARPIPAKADKSETN